MPSVMCYRCLLKESIRSPDLVECPICGCITIIRLDDLVSITGDRLITRSKL